MIQPVIAGNWKMNKTIAEAVTFAACLRTALATPPERQVIVAPPFTALKAVADTLQNSFIRLAAQNLHAAGKGAYTGEISGEMLKEAGCACVIVGHSERRTLFSESDAVVNRKLAAALQVGLQPIFCIGETLLEREGGRTPRVLERQLKEGLNNLTADDIGLCIAAYEPVWAIGTGKTASPEQAQEAHRFIREWVAGQYGSPVAERLTILYGGSVTPQNAADLLAQPDINGALVGGASLDVETFVRIIHS